MKESEIKARIIELLTTEKPQRYPLAIEADVIAEEIGIDKSECIRLLEDMVDDDILDFIQYDEADIDTPRQYYIRQVKP